MKWKEDILPPIHNQFKDTDAKSKIGETSSIMARNMSSWHSPVKTLWFLLQIRRKLCHKPLRDVTSYSVIPHSKETFVKERHTIMKNTRRQKFSVSNSFALFYDWVHRTWAFHNIFQKWSLFKIIFSALLECTYSCVMLIVIIEIKYFFAKLFFGICFYQSLMSIWS